MTTSGKKILIVSRSFYPQSSPRAFRTTELVKEFARQNHDVTLITLRNDLKHKEFEKKFNVTIKDFGPLRFKPVQRGKGPGWMWLLKSAIRLVSSQLLEYPDIELVWKVKEALRDESGYHLMISIAVPHPVHWGVALARTESRRIADAWAADCGDPYMGFKMERLNKAFYFRFAEKGFCKRADYITVPFEGAKKAYYPEFRDKIRVIPQGFNFDEVPINSDAYSRHEVPTFAYAGDLLGGGRNPHPLLTFLADSNLDYKFIIYTRQDHVLRPYLDKANGKIEIREYIPRNHLLPKLAGMDFLVNFNNKSTAQLPSKLIDYSIAGRPILSLSGDSLNTKLVNEFLNGNYKNRHIIENIRSYRIENVCNEFLKLSD